MIAIICGGRHFSDGVFVFDHLDRLRAERQITMVVEGGQRTYQKGRAVGGADFFAHEWAVARRIKVKTERAEWGNLSHPDALVRTSPSGRKYDANAGFRRNALMLVKYQPKLVIAFPGGNGTADMCERAEAAGVELLRVAP